MPVLEKEDILKEICKKLSIKFDESKFTSAGSTVTSHALWEIFISIYNKNRDNKQEIFNHICKILDIKPSDTYLSEGDTVTRDGLNAILQKL